jgi:periplasmic protein TonB
MLGPSILLMAQVPGAPARIRISEKVSQTFIVSKVQPAYPDEARRKHIQGSVVMQAEISKEGNVEYLKVLSGDPLLAPAATKAVKEWKYKPYLLSDQPIAVETQVTVNFTLDSKAG